MNCGCGWKWRMIIAVNFPIYATGKKKPEKIRASGKIWTQLIDLAPNVWLHSSVGRASHRYSRRSRVRIPPFFCFLFFVLFLFFFLSFWLLHSSYLNWKIYCDDHSSLSSTTAVHIWIISYKLHIISLLTGRYELNKLTSLPMCGFIAQLVEHRTGIAELTGSNPVEALIFFSGFSFPIA